MKLIGKGLFSKVYRIDNDNVFIKTTDSVKECLHEVLGELSNYGSDIRFEISPRNVAVDNGRLVLLDVFFLQSEANEIIKNSNKYKYC